MPSTRPVPSRRGQHPAPKRRRYLAVFFFLFAVPLFAIHLQLLNLPFFWDEHGQFIPTALDLLRQGAWVARSTVPNVHPPGVEVYLVAWYKLFGFSIPVTRIAMLLVAGFGLLFTFLLAIELSREAKGAPAFLPPFLLLVSPLFYMQSMMAQLDMPAMVLTLLVLLLFLKEQYAWAVLASVGLALVKETGIVVPFVCFLVLVWRRRFWRACWFIAPAAALAGWLIVLHRATEYWLGDPGFAHYNVAYALHPARMALSLARRIYYLFFAEFRWIGTLILLITAKKCRALRTPGWAFTVAASLLTLLLVSILGGAELERYLLPVLPVFYIAVSVAMTSLTNKVAFPAAAALLIGLAANIFWNPPYPFPYENNYAMVDFVRLQQLASAFAERHLGNSAIATAWPYTSALEHPDYGFVTRKLNVVETNDFHPASIRAIPAARFDTLITYTRTWAPATGVIAIPLVREFLQRFYEWEPPITTEECLSLGLHPVISWTARGQTIAIYRRGGN